MARSFELFDPYPVSGYEIRAAAEQSTTSMDALDDLEGEVRQQHQPALDAAEGEIEPHVQTAPYPAVEQSRQVIEKVNFAQGALTLFAIAVDDFNLTSEEPRSISKLNAAYNAAAANSFDLNYDDYQEGGPNEGQSWSDAWVAKSQELQHDLRIEHGRLEQNLDTAAEEVSGMLQRGPNAEDIRELFRAGALPIHAAAMFPDVTFTRDDWEAYLIERAEAGDLPAMTFVPEEYRDSLLDDADVMEAVRDGLAVDGDVGETDASTVVDGERGPSFFQVENNLAWVTAYAGFAQRHDGYELTDDQRAYLSSFYEGVTAEGLPHTMELLDDLGLSDHNDEDATFRRNFANGLLALSDESIGGGLDQLPDRVLEDLADVPTTDYDTVGTGPVTTTISLTGGDGFRAFSELISTGTLQPGTDFATDMNHTVSGLAGTLLAGLDNGGDPSDDDYMNAYEHWDAEVEAYGPLMEQVLDVSTRNEEANAALLSSAASSDDGERELLDLYRFPWADDGASMAGVTDWISHASASEDADDVERADQATADLINFLTNEHEVYDPYDDETTTVTNFDTLMTGVSTGQLTLEDGEHTLSLAEQNPAIVQSFGSVAASHLGDLSATPPGTGDTAYSSDTGLDISLEDRSRFFTLLASDETTRTNLSISIGTFQQANLDHALATGDANDLENAGAANSRLDGYITGGTVNAALILDHTDYTSAVEAYNEHLQNANVGKALLGSIISPIPDPTGAAGNGFGLLYDQLVIGEIQPPPIPDGQNTTEIGSEDILRSQAQYDYVQAQLRAGTAPPEVEEMATDGNLPPYTSMSSSELDDLTAHLAGDPAFAAYVQRYFGAGNFNDIALNDEGTYIEQEVRDYLNGN